MTPPPIPPDYINPILAIILITVFTITYLVLVIRERRVNMRAKARREP